MISNRYVDDSINESHVVACIPYFRGQQYVKRAVESLLKQTHKNLTVVVVNDADFETPPWPSLCEINDPRLIRFDLYKNRGPYFATQVVLQATNANYLLIQDADDWSHPDRITQLLKIIRKENTDFAVSARLQIYETDDSYKKKTKNQIPTRSDLKLDNRIKNRISHHGLYKTEALNNIGGYFGGFYVSYDMFITNLILMTGNVSVIPRTLYHYYKRYDSLTTSEITGMNSKYRRNVDDQLQKLYTTAHGYYIDFVNGKISNCLLIKKIRLLTSNTISNEENNALIQESTKLMNIIGQ